MKILVVIDMQKDFCSPNGSLANPAAKIATKMSGFKQEIKTESKLLI